MSKAKNEIDLLCYLTLRSTDFLVYSAAGSEYFGRVIVLDT